MNEEIGVWIDHKQAVILTSAGSELGTVTSDLSRFRFTGGSRGKTAYASNYFPAEDHEDRHYATELNRYYDAVIAILRGARAVMIVGPGEAKLELQKRLEHAGLRELVHRVETTGRLTAPQLAARIREFYNEHKVTA